MDFTPAQLATMTRFPVGSIITLATLGGEITNHKAKITRWTLHTYETSPAGDKQETGLCFHMEGAGDVPPTRTAQIAENTPRKYNILHGYDSQENCVSTDDYPYGSLRCTCRWWVETATKGAGKGQQRFAQQTINPKNKRTNAPKFSTYTDMQLIYVDDIGHVHNYSFSVVYGPSGIQSFLTTGLFAQLNEAEKTRLAALVKYARKYQPNEWARFDLILKLARTLEAHPEALPSAITKEAQHQRPDDHNIYEADAIKALEIVKAETETGVTFDL